MAKVKIKIYCEDGRELKAMQNKRRETRKQKGLPMMVILTVLP